jgi:membrane protease YdiL (CAAX protease family)
VVICGVQLVSLQRMARLPAERQGTIAQILVKLMPRGGAESVVFVALAATAGVCEEFIYRGFALSVLEGAAGGSAPFGIAASSALFAIAHLYQGRRGMAATFVAGVVFAVSRELSGSLAPAMVAHAAVDAAAGLLAGRLLAARAGADGAKSQAAHN